MRIVNQSRFLILPGITVPHLASHALALTARQLPQDWAVRYGYMPVLFKTFVEPPWTRWPPMPVSPETFPERTS